MWIQFYVLMKLWYNLEVNCNEGPAILYQNFKFQGKHATVFEEYQI